jgi:hypothetical protein
MLEVRRNKFAKSYENEFFRILSRKLSALFKELNLSGVLFGSPVCVPDTTFKPDLLLVSELGVIVIDLKKYGGKVILPDEDNFESGKWINKPNFEINDEQVEIKGGNSENPFKQLLSQKEKLIRLLEENVQINLPKKEKLLLNKISTVICFQKKIILEGKIPGKFEVFFYVADPDSIVNKVSDVLNIETRTISEQAFFLFKKNFRADKYDPFEDTSLFGEFEKIDFPDESSEEEQIESEFKENESILEKFLTGDCQLLKIEADTSSNWIGFTQRVVSEYLKRKGIDDSDPDMESGVCFLAPSNKYVNQILRLNGPASTRSLYGKLYNFENTDIELLSNNINEREVFPLEENDDPIGILYVIFYSHLVYDFSPDSEDLVRFGTGSLSKDTYSYIDPIGRKNKIILVDDPYFYGFRANTMGSEISIQSENLNYLSLPLKSRPIEPNQKSIFSLISNFKRQEFNNFSFQGNPNISFLFGEEFKTEVRNLIKTGKINASKILTREPADTSEINNAIRKIKGVTENKIQAGDVVWLKNKALVPEEEMDPFSIPKFVQSGDIGEILSIVGRTTFNSEKYSGKWKPIEVTQVKIRLLDYDNEKDLYLASFPASENMDLKDQKKHIQIRCRELIDEYLFENDITYKDILSPEELVEFLKLKEAIQIQARIDKSSEELASEGLKKLEAKWKINKRKQKYAGGELLKDASSEYFQLTQLVQFEFAWALCLKNVYGYYFPESYLVKYPAPTKDPRRIHQFLYSALSVTERIKTHDLTGFHPWMGVEAKNNAKEKSNLQVNTEYLFEPDNSELTEFESEIYAKYFTGTEDKRLAKICHELLNRIEGETEFQLDRIGHFNYQEKYYFISGPKPLLFEFHYDKNFKVKKPASSKGNAIWDILLKEELIEKEPFIFYPDESWQSKELKKLQEQLLALDAFIYDFKHGDWHYMLQIKAGVGEGIAKLTYNKNGFFTGLEMISFSGYNPFSLINQAVEKLKTL